MTTWRVRIVGGDNLIVASDRVHFERGHLVFYVRGDTVAVVANGRWAALTRVPPPDDEPTT